MTQAGAIYVSQMAQSLGGRAVGAPQSSPILTSMPCITPLRRTCVVWPMLVVASAPILWACETSRSGIVVAGLSALSIVVPQTARAAKGAQGPPAVRSLGLGDAHFWDGAYVREARVKAQSMAYFFEGHATDPCATETAPCFLYQIKVTEPEGRLRIGLDSATRDDWYGMEVRRPDGQRVAGEPGSDGSEGGFAHNAEVVAPIFNLNTWNLEIS